MQTANPGQTITISESGIPTGQAVGYQVIKAASGTVAIGRTTTGVIERPSGSGNYVITFVAPVEGDLYLIVLDWSAGVLAPETSRVVELQVIAAVSTSPSGLGAVADYVKVAIGGENFKALHDSVDYGDAFIARAIAVVKARTFLVPPVTIDEAGLSVIVVSYLGKLAALELMSALRSYWNLQYQSQSLGDDPVEVITYPNRQSMLDELAKDLLAKVHAEQQLALSLVDGPRLRSAGTGPAIDEEDDMGRVTDDPRCFPGSDEFPYGPGSDLVVPIRRREFVR